MLYSAIRLHGQLDPASLSAEETQGNDSLANTAKRSCPIGGPVILGVTLLGAELLEWPSPSLKNGQVIIGPHLFVGGCGPCW